MNKATIKQLKNRWDTQQTNSAQAAIMGKELFPFPEIDDGHLDLRGITISEIVRGAKIRYADLSNAVFSGFGQFGMCEFENTLFCNASLQTNLGKRFDSCDFSASKMSGAVLRGLFSNCDFSFADLTSTMGSEVQFINCRFNKTKFRKATLLHCLFEGCTFDECDLRKGSLSFSKFIRSPIEESLLTDTLMEKVVFQD